MWAQSGRGTVTKLYMFQVADAGGLLYGTTFGRGTDGGAGTAVWDLVFIAAVSGGQ
jgi:hypothetical protein